MAGLHAFFPPSGCAETVACALWPTMNALYPQEETQDSMEGTAAHWVGAELHAGRMVAEGRIAPNGVMLTEEIIESGQALADALQGPGWSVEEPVGDRTSLSWGTPDAKRLSPRLLEVKDLKHGFLPVDPYEWWQGIDYARLYLKQLDIIDRPDEMRVEFEVIQPRTYGRGGGVWRTTLSELKPYFARIEAAHAAALEPQPVASTGPQCDYCPGRHACPTLQMSALRIAHHRGESPPMELSDQALGREAITLRRSIKLMQARLTGLEADAESRLRNGRPVAFHALVPSTGREAWTATDAEIVAVGDAMGVQLGKVKALTPAQARKAGMPDDVVAAMSHRPSTGMKLVEDDGRAAAKVFDGGVKVS